MPSRKLEDLHPVPKARAERFLQLCSLAGIDILVTCTKRSAAEQDELYAQGRTKPGPIVTNARGGESSHQYGVALDVVPLRNGKPVWGTSGEDGKLWNEVGRLGKMAGLDWAGDWKTFREFPHFEYRGGLTLADLKAGKIPV